MREEVVVLLAVVFMAFFVQITLEVSKCFSCIECNKLPSFAVTILKDVNFAIYVQILVTI